MCYASKCQSSCAMHKATELTANSSVSWKASLADGQRQHKQPIACKQTHHICCSDLKGKALPAIKLGRLLHVLCCVQGGRCVLPWWLRLRLAAQISAAIAYLHTLPSSVGGPLIHRDIKPANMFLDGRLNAKVSWMLLEPLSYCSHVIQ